ncbi:MAG: tail fiber protein [Rhizomicrobium sp.]
MSTPYLGEIRMFGGNFAPRNNAQANGQLLAIAQNTALFSLLGTFYGGNGTSTFALPDLRSRVPIGQGNGPGLTPRVIGELDGAETVTISSTTMPLHTHLMSVTNNPATTSVPAGRVPAALAAPWTKYWVDDANKSGQPIELSTAMVKVRGSNLPHENRQPFLAITYIVALVGVFPSRN